MTTLSTTTTYRCDGCGVESPNPHGWRSFRAVFFGGQSVFVGDMAQNSEDYCHECVAKMRACVKKVIA